MSRARRAWPSDSRFDQPLTHDRPHLLTFTPPPHPPQIHILLPTLVTLRTVTEHLSKLSSQVLISANHNGDLRFEAGRGASQSIEVRTEWKALDVPRIGLSITFTLLLSFTLAELGNLTEQSTTRPRTSQASRGPRTTSSAPRSPSRRSSAFSTPMSSRELPSPVRRFISACSWARRKEN